MASQELDGVVRHKGHVVLLAVVVLFHTTRFGEQVLPEGGIGGDALGLDLGEILRHSGGGFNGRGGAGDGCDGKDFVHHCEGEL